MTVLIRPVYDVTWNFFLNSENPNEYENKKQTQTTCRPYSSIRTEAKRVRDERATPAARVFIIYQSGL